VECVRGRVAWVKISSNLCIIRFAVRKTSITLSFPYPRFRLGDHGFTVRLRIWLVVAVRVSQEREEIFVGSEGFDGLALQRVGAGKKRDEPERQ